ncbi:MAG: hypothetical protein A3K65_00025 [Euryarchaeota archaeon RBG_16_68_12]|nr:MAG: hypothetical protein A3K65_00025 [Euryarchaeota archaeon RBG_16_68_12]
MSPDPEHVYDRVLAEMKAVWGEMAAAMLRKRLRDVEVADPAHLSRPAPVRVVHLLREKTLPAVLGPEGAELKARLWLSWVEDGGGAPTLAGAAASPASP